MVAVAVTFALLVAIGGVVMLIPIVLLDLLAAPGWVQALPWLVPTLVTLGWNLYRPGPAVLSDDDDERWSGYALRTVLVGTDRPRAVPLRVLASLLFGGPVGWLLLVAAVADIPAGF